MKKQTLFIVISVTILSLIMNFVDMFIKPQYFIKAIIKAILFLVAPFVYFMINKEEFERLKKLFILRKKALLLSMLLGVFCYVALLVGYFVLKNFIDFSNITKSLTSDIGVTANNFIYVATYISLFNSFLEEFFFRGFAFITLKNHTSRKVAYLFSSFIFAFYHIGMTFGWVELPVFIAGLIGLAIGGMIFDYLNEKNGTIYSSWIVHMFINFGINTIGFILFGVL